MSLEAASRRLIRLAFEEDLGAGVDLTTFALIEQGTQGQVDVVARKPGVAAGLIAISWAFEELADRPEFSQGSVSCEQQSHDGDRLIAGQCLARLSGNVQWLLIAERTILNILMHLSGIATLTAKFVDAVRGLPVAILDTRKTLPGWRALEKYAVHCGGGVNHRMGLYDGVLIKDNHLASAAKSKRTIAQSIEAARTFAPQGIKIEVEVDTLAQLKEALAAGADIVLLDNMTPDQLCEAVAIRNAAGLVNRVQLEASGGVTLDTVRAIAESGVERISIGALTHSAPALDIGFDWR
jgi:nicotinate-nucleotide pyrophosphorylase (carboxylating)